MGLVAFTLAALVGGLVSLFLSRFALDRLALALGILALGALFVGQTVEDLPEATRFAWWALLGLAFGFTAASLVRSVRDLLGRS